ncbi:hypothetical protein BU25DRAFT_495128 [Macroventuria anomochaeta]|uniref:Uncharacterized protein n=1 Tax=Macroventuria anomochaeta TaxID=301207 RepID=A0ACB6RKH7_9PLEO|nr:uncharacterized protein BU25DRAFT_495128 [Macroventuria anomochaeta]KAF2622406.1 hypothetical protein BU25DRAFT_495128 [Macroventuria anomochaeta]
MGEYEELVELGFEGVDKVVDKYHDKAFDKVGKHSPSWHRRHDRQQQQQGVRNPPASESSRANRDTSRGRDDSESNSDMYAPDRRQERDYQDRRDTRYVSDETFYHRGPDAGAVVMRGSDPYNNARGYEVQQYREPQYDNRRPQPQRRRSSWSPQRSGRDRGNDRHARSRSRSRSRSKDRHHRIAATVAGGLIGGLIGNQVQKGRKYDTAATIAGAVIGGLGAREASEQWDKRRVRREDCDEKWDEKYGDDRDRRRDDRRDDQYDERDNDRRRHQDRDWR